jgi:plastocyanin
MAVVVFAVAVLAIGGSAAMLARSAMAGGGGCHEPRTDAAGESVDLRNNCFLPTVLRVDTGATVTFTSLDKQPHTVTGAGVHHPDGWGDFEELGEGTIVTHTFTEPGVYPYFCLLHPGMVGTIVVGDTGATVASLPEGDTNNATASPIADEEGDRTVAASIGISLVLLALVAASAAAVVRMLRRRHT